MIYKTLKKLAQYVSLMILVMAKSEAYNILDDYPMLDFALNDDVVRNNVCTSEGCLSAARVIRYNIDTRHNPCVNFYAFACGGFFKKNELPDNLEMISPLTKIENKVNRELKILLEEKQNKKEPRIFTLVKKFYKNCVNLEKLNYDGSNTLRTIIYQLGGWPIVAGKKWDGSKFDWVKTDVKLRKMGFNPVNIFTIFVINDPRNTTKNALYINPVTTYLESNTLKLGTINIIVAFYKQFIRRVALYLNANEDRAEREAKDIVEFEIKLALAAGKQGIDKKIITTISDLNEYVPSMPWEDYINNLTDPVIKIDPSEPIIRTRNPHFISNVKKLLDATPKRTIANYMVWRAVASSAPHLGGQIREIFNNFKRKVTGEDLPGRPMECVKLLTEKTGLTVGVSALYIRRYFDNKTIEVIKPVLESILKQFEDLVEKSDWMDDQSKRAAIKKSMFMKRIIAYPNELLHDSVIDEYTAGLDFYDKRFLKNVLTLQRFHFDYALTGLHDLTDQRLWVTLSDSTVSNAYYYVLNNAFALLAGILQPPIFNIEWPNYAKFGSIGFIIAHEMMHAYDPKNIQCDEVGNYHPWLAQKKVADEYRKRSACFSTQYSGYKDPTTNKTVDGDLTLNENIADNVGLKISFNAFKNWESRHPNQPRLPGLDYTPEQIFWISSVHFLCNKNTPNYRKEKMKTDPHTLYGFRVWGSVSNSKDFAEAFHCPVGSPYNPKEKCLLW